MGAALAMSNLTRGAIALVTSLVIARGLGREGFGLWTLCTAGTSALTVAFDLGFGVLLTREAARGDRPVGALLANALATRLTLFLPVALLAHLAAPHVPMGALPLETVHGGVALAAVGLAYGCLASVSLATPRRLVTILTIENAGAAVQCGGAALVVARGGTIPALLYLATAVLVAQAVAAFVLWRTGAAQGRLERPSVRSAWAALRRAFPFALTGLVANAQARLAPLMLGYLGGAGEVAAFGVASRLESVARRLPSAAFGAALPVFSREMRRGQPDAVRARFDGTLRLFAVAAAGALVVGATPLVRFTYGVHFAAAAKPLLVAGLGLVPAIVNSGRKVYLYAAGREQIALRWSVVTLAVQTTACFALVPHFGAAGAMCGLAFGEAIVWLPLRMADVS